MRTLTVSEGFTRLRYRSVFCHNQQFATDTSGTANLLTAVFGFSSTNVYPVGEYETFLHYDGATWRQVGVEGLADRSQQR